MGYQFIHVESYCTKSKAKQGKAAGEKTWSTKDILDGVNREPGACYHVKSPKPPTWEIGSRENIEKAVNAWMAEKSATGRKRRPDTPVLLAGVISLGKEQYEIWDDYKRDCLDYLKNKYGDNLVGVAEHTDEEHPHIHFYAVPRPDQEYSDIHEGQRAFNKAKREVGTKTACIKARAAAMSGLQDEFYAAVSQRHGLDKLGPRRQRMTRDGWKRGKEFAALKAEILKEEREKVVNKLKHGKIKLHKEKVVSFFSKLFFGEPSPDQEDSSHPS